MKHTRREKEGKQLINFEIKKDIYEKFKKELYKDGKNVTFVLRNFIYNYINEKNPFKENKYYINQK